MIISQKKSQGHIEIILSFILFLGFLITIFIFLNPLKQEKLSYATLNNVEQKLMNNLSVNYKHILLKINSDIESPLCFTADNLPGFSGNLVVKNDTGVMAATLLSENSISIEYISKFNFIYSSDRFIGKNLPSSSSCSALEKEQYTFGAMNIDRAVLYENIEGLNRSYNANYGQLKENLGIKEDFVFIVYDIDRNVLFNESLLKIKMPKIGVLSRDIPLKAINANASYSNIIINLRAW